MVRRFARPYARAIMDITRTPDAAKAVRDELARFEQARAASTDLGEVFANPGIDMAAKLAIASKIAARLGMSELGTKAIELLVRNYRINQLGAIVEALTTYVNQILGVAVAEVRTAHALSAEEQAELRKTLEKKLGKRVEIQATTDPTLLGGFVARIGSEIYDASVTGKIDKFRTSLT